MASVYLERLTWLESEQALARIPTVLVPIGAASKEHGPHLPNNTDWLVVNELARRVAEAAEVVVAPTIGFGFYDAFVEFPGTIHLEAGTFSALVVDICRSLHRNGARRFFVLNNGLSTAFPLNLAISELSGKHGIPAVACHTGQLARGVVQQVVERPVGSHADEAETSLMLAVAPAAVRLELRTAEVHDWMRRPPAFVDRGPLRRSPDAAGRKSASGVIGDPTLASAEKGETLLRAYVEEIVAFLRDW